jgi:putative nucleotidyltransferase with HDIG domain
LKKRILFVDDEPFMLHGLQRMFRPLRNEWETEFVETGAKALERIAQGPCDVVVSDLVMPGMNGVLFLNEVRRRHPSSVRFILSGQSDPEIVMECVGVAHQFLAKPCEVEDLETAIRRALKLDTALQNEAVKKLVSQMDRIPSIPSVYVEVVRKLQKPEVALEEVAEVIARDIGMTAKILKLVNSAFFGLPHEVSSPVDAIAYLGLDMIKALVLALKAFSQYEAVELSGITLNAIWQHSLTTAGAAKQIARAQKAPRDVLEHAFTGGLLHDMGKLILASNFKGQYAEAVNLSQSGRIELWAAEQQIFGATHSDVGAYLLGLWGLPVSVVDAIALHHAPATGADKAFTALTAVHTANVLVQQEHLGAGLVPPQLDLPYLERLDLAKRVDAWKQALAASR